MKITFTNSDGEKQVVASALWTIEVEDEQGNSYAIGLDLKEGLKVRANNGMLSIMSNMANVITIKTSK